MRHTVRGIVALMALGALLLAAACQRPDASPYPILDSGFPASTNDKLYWLDNDRVIFVSLGPKPKSLEEAERNPRVPSIHIWDTRTNTVTLYARGSHLCYSDGYIKYMGAEKVPDDPQRPVTVDWREGPLNKPELKIVRFRTEEEYREWYHAHVFNPHTCRWVERPGYAKGRGVMPLREGDGWLVSDNAAKEWVWHRPDGRVERTGIPYWVNSVQWMAFAGGYFAQDNSNSSAAQSLCMPYWWLKPDSEIQKGCVNVGPVKALWKGNVGLIATPLGILVSANGLTDYSTEGGFYRIAGDKAIRVLNDMGTWSPDGCKAAYVEVPGYEGLRVGGRGDVRLNMVNVCASNGQGR